MNLPEQPELRCALAVAGAIAATGTTRAVVRGSLAPAVLKSVLAYLRDSAGDITVVDNAWDAVSLPYTSDSCAWLISGLTSYHAAYDQLYAVRAACREQRTPTFVIIPQLQKELAWRDHYEHPEAVPLPWRHQSETCVLEGCAMHRSLSPGGPHNGVLNAIEDFMAEASDEGVELAWAHVRALKGLYVMFDLSAPWARELARCLLQLRGRETGTATIDEFPSPIVSPRPRRGQSKKGKE